MKKHRFRRHPVQIDNGFLGPGEEWAGIVAVEEITSYLTSGSLSSGRSTLNIAELAADQSIDVPEGAIAAILGVDVQDSGASGAAAYLAVGYGGIADISNYPGRTQVVYCPVGDDRWAGRTLVVPLTEANLIDYLAEATGGSTLDYRVKLLGWVIGGTDYTMPEHPYQDLSCDLYVNS